MDHAPVAHRDADGIIELPTSTAEGSPLDHERAGAREDLRETESTSGTPAPLAVPGVTPSGAWGWTGGCSPGRRTAKSGHAPAIGT
jgi:hypothetical protein